MDFLKFAPYSRSEIAAGAGVSQSVIKTMIDAGVLKEVLVEKKRDFQNPVCGFHKVELTAEQKLAADELCCKVGNGFSVTLLNGVTGSGKTEVYFEAVEKAFSEGKQVLIMVPEIGLTAQWLKRFEKRFGVVPAEWHSALSQNERINNWKAVVNGKAKIIIGAVMEAVGIKNIRTKSHGSQNPGNCVKAAIEGLKELKSAEQVAALRGKTVEEILS